MLMNVILYTYLIIIVLASVAFYTLVERKVLGYINFRMGPNKVGVAGLFQPFADAIKLFSKNQYRLNGNNFYYFFVAPFFGLFIMFLLWVVFLGVGSVFNLSTSFFFLFCVVSLGVYPILAKGWFSGSTYSMMGGYRACAQAISYEISMAFLIIMFLIILTSIEVSSVYSFLAGVSFSFFLFFFFVFFLWVIICLCEANRSPFDLAEGESELVSGFNTEYSGGYFSLIFISEYGSIVFLGFYTTLLFSGGGAGCFIILFICFTMVWIRGTFPRIRYDSLMKMAWKMVLVYIIVFYFFSIYV